MATRRLDITFDKVTLRYSDLSWKRLSNWLLAEVSYRLRLERPWGLPTHLQVEPINICNLRCPVCHVVTDSKPRGALSVADFQRIMDEVGDYLLFLHFWGWGEPFLNPDFLEMVRYAKGKGVKIITSTNGHFFESAGSVDALIDSGLDVLIFALDGVDRETYEKYRHNGDFDRVLTGLRALAERKRERGATTPVINLRMLVTRDNEGQIEAMKALAQEVGVDLFTLKTLCSFDNALEGEKLLPSDPAYRRFTYDNEGRPIRRENPCKKLWNHPTVYRDGTVVPCDYYTGEELSLGNMLDGSSAGFRGVWYGDVWRNLRRRFRRHAREGLRCDGCSLNYADVDRCVSHAFPIVASRAPAHADGVTDQGA
ncbi:MAG: radical SAM/SPASM domain-containing protein [Anaerolineae bacterium]